VTQGELVVGYLDVPAGSNIFHEHRDDEKLVVGINDVLSLTCGIDCHLEVVVPHWLIQLKLGNGL
ncbi:MAG: hypothetical protein ACYDEZ_02855, partial [Methanoregula sp.]